jgi:hypothetical protein
LLGYYLGVPLTPGEFRGAPPGATTCFRLASTSDHVGEKTAVSLRHPSRQNLLPTTTASAQQKCGGHGCEKQNRHNNGQPTANHTVVCCALRLPCGFTLLHSTRAGLGPQSRPHRIECGGRRLDWHDTLTEGFGEGRAWMAEAQESSSREYTRFSLPGVQHRFLAIPSKLPGISRESLHLWHAAAYGCQGGPPFTMFARRVTEAFAYRAS